MYGIPGELLGWQDETSITVTIPTVFLDNHGGGIFFTLMPEPGSEFLPETAGVGKLADVSVTYLPEQGSERAPQAHAVSIAVRRRMPAERRHDSSVTC